MRRYLSVALIVMACVSNAWLTTAQPDGDKRLYDIVNFWEQSSDYKK